MPELPEVETVCRGLRARIIGRSITALTMHRQGLRFPFPRGMAKQVTGRKIAAVERLAKYILLRLDDGARILLHLGMSGRFFYADKKTYERGKHDHVVFAFDKTPLLIFNDARRFGVMDYLKPGEATHKLLSALGVDPLSRKLTAAFLYDSFTLRKTTVKALLMDQTIIAGLGNIYVCETLFRAKIWPERMGNSVTKAESTALVHAIKEVLRAALDAGGSSLRDYVQPDGELGFFQDRFRVYGRAGKPCLRCKTPIARFVQNGRSSFACPKCQK